ncbi:MAG: hypothetical protein K1X44_05620 [Alphaproteobacteria bacterium]|nr:hypothetical protein [Alphaproteobacteria bacterium]
MIGIITGLLSEAKILYKSGKEPTFIKTAVGNKKITEKLAWDLVEQGAKGLLSFGLAGGLTPEIKSGDIIIPDQVLTKNDMFTTDYIWHQNIVRYLSVNNLSIKQNKLLGSDIPLISVEQKKSMHDIFNVSCVDMESHHVARVAQQAKLPFLVIRVIIDTYNDQMPSFIIKAMQQDGTITIIPLFKGIMVEPTSIYNMAKLGINFFKAIKQLRRVARCLPITCGLQ